MQTVLSIIVEVELKERFKKLWAREKNKDESISQGRLFKVMLDRWEKNGGTYDANNKIRREIDKQ